MIWRVWVRLGSRPVFSKIFLTLGSSTSSEPRSSGILFSKTDTLASNCVGSTKTAIYDAVARCEVSFRQRKRLNLERHALKGNCRICTESVGFLAAKTVIEIKRHPMGTRVKRNTLIVYRDEGCAAIITEDDKNQ